MRALSADKRRLTQIEMIQSFLLCWSIFRFTYRISSMFILEDQKFTEFRSFEFGILDLFEIWVLVLGVISQSVSE